MAKPLSKRHRRLLEGMSTGYRRADSVEWSAFRSAVRALGGDVTNGSGSSLRVTLPDLRPGRVGSLQSRTTHGSLKKSKSMGKKTQERHALWMRLLGYNYEVTK